MSKLNFYKLISYVIDYCHRLSESQSYQMSEKDVLSVHSRGHYNIVKKTCYCTCKSDDYINISKIRSLMPIRDDKMIKEIMPVHCGL